MKFKVIVLNLLVAILFLQICNAETSKGKSKGKTSDSGTSQNQAVESFEAIVKKFSDFFKTKPKFVVKQNFSGSPTGVTYEIAKYEVENISYDVQKTDSLISSLMGNINVKYSFINNNSCGNIKISTGTYGWDNIEGAIKNSDNESCWGWDLKELGIKPLSDVDKYIFAYQKGKWILKDIVFNNKYESWRMLPVFGMANENGIIINESSGVLFNQKWLDLVKDLK